MEGDRAIDQAFVFHDMNNLSAYKVKGDDKAALSMAAKQFESIFLQMLMKTMRDSNNLIAEGGPFSSGQHQFYQRMFDEQLTLSLSKNSQLGIADLIVQQLSGDLRQNPSSSQSEGKAIAVNTPPIHDASMPVYSGPTGNPTIPHASQADSRKFDAVAIDQSKARSSGSKKSTAQVKENSSDGNSMAGLDFSSPQGFIESLLPYAKKAASLLGFSPQYLLAQAALETGWGKFMMKKADGQPANNLFGIKADNSWKGEVAVKDTLEFDGSQMTKERATFRAYQHVADSFMDYAEFITRNPRYENARANNQNAQSYFTELQSAGYATDPNYADKILNILSSEHFQSP